MSKRLVSILLCMIFMLTSVGVFADEAVSEEITASVEETMTEEVETDAIEIDWEAIGLLETLGIIDDVDEKTAQEFLSAQFSRAEFAVALIKFNNLENAMSANTEFNDVVPESKEEPYINAAVDMGLIAAVTDGYFYPQYPISYQDAAQAFVMSLGYTVVAEQNNSWLIQAKRLGLMDGIDTGSAFTRMQAYKMLFNALHAEVMEISGIEGDVINYDTYAGYDALNKFFNVKHEEGIITAAGGLELGVGAMSSNEYIKQNGKLYKYIPHKMEEHLGKNAVVYYKNSDQAVYVLNKRNEELVIPAEEINGYANYTYDYNEDNKKATISNAYVIRNGEEYLGSQNDQAIMKPVSGSVTLIDTDNDGAYEVVYINEYIDYVIKLKLQNPSRIVDYFGNTVSVDKNSKNVEFYDKDGKNLEFAKVNTETVASVMESTSSVKVYISTDSVTGAISQVSTKLGKNVWRIDGKDYTLSKSLRDAISGTLIDSAKIGETYKFYLNIYGEIAYYEKAKAATGDGKFYGFITAAKIEGIGNDEMSIKVFAKDFGGFESLKVPKRITLNGSNATPQRVYNALLRDGVDGRVSGNGRIIPQPVIMKINENNEVTYISQASVADYYKELYEPVFGMVGSNRRIVGFTQLGTSFPPPDDPSYEAEFRLVTGHFSQNGKGIAYRDILEMGYWKWSNIAPGTGVSPNWNYKDGDLFVKQETHPYDDVDNGNKFFTQIGLREDVQVYQVPYYKTGVNAGSVATDKEDFFAGAGIATNTEFPFYAYAEGDSIEASYITTVVDADTPATVGEAFNIQVVIDISEAYVNEAAVTVLKTNERTVYIEKGKIDLNALKLYDYTNNPVMESDGVTHKTYKLKPGDLVNVAVDALGYATAVEPVFDCETYTMLGSGGSQTAEYYAKRGTPDYRIQKLSLLRVDGGSIQMVRGDAPGTPTAMKQISMMPNSLLKVEKVRGVVTTANATKADLISYEDSTTEYVTIIFASRYLSLGGNVCFVYPNRSQW